MGHKRWNDCYTERINLAISWKQLWNQFLSYGNDCELQKKLSSNRGNELSDHFCSHDIMIRDLVNQTPLPDGGEDCLGNSEKTQPCTLPGCGKWRSFSFQQNFSSFHQIVHCGSINDLSANPFSLKFYSHRCQMGRVDEKWRVHCNLWWKWGKRQPMFSTSIT